MKKGFIVLGRIVSKVTRLVKKGIKGIFVCEEMCERLVFLIK